MVGRPVHFVLNWQYRGDNIIIFNPYNVQLIDINGQFIRLIFSETLNMITNNIYNNINSMTKDNLSLFTVKVACTLVKVACTLLCG